MSGINCGTYPVPTTTDAQTTLEEQTTEYLELQNTYQTLLNAYYPIEGTYDQDLENYGIQVESANNLLSVKPVSQVFNGVATDVDILTTNTTIAVNPYSSTNIEYYCWSPDIAFNEVETQSLGGIMFRCLSNSILVGSITRDLGNQIINSTDENTKMSPMFLYYILSNIPANNSFFTAKTLTGTGITTSFLVSSKIYTLSVL